MPDNITFHLDTILKKTLKLAPKHSMVITPINIINLKRTSVTPLKRAALLAAPSVANILIRVPQIIPAGRAVVTFNEDAAATGLITPAVPAQGAGSINELASNLKTIQSKRRGLPGCIKLRVIPM